MPDSQYLQAVKCLASPTDHFFVISQSKDKSFVERVIGSLRPNASLLAALPTASKSSSASPTLGPAKYHFYRPHATLNYLTPHEFAKTMEAGEV